MKRVFLTLLLLSLLIFSGCIVSSSPTSPAITMDKGDPQEFSVVVFPTEEVVKWTVQYLGIIIDTATGLSYTFTPEWSGEFQITVEDKGSNGYGYNRIWLIDVN
jgi:ABC-type phosphate/phosphonate transport system substrate-binding protein